MEKVAILGLGLSGKAALKKLQTKGYNQFVIIDKKSSELESSKWPYVKDQINFDKSSLEGVGLCVLSPGVGPTSPALAALRSAQVKIIGEMELGLQDLKGTKVVITGSNGKSTTVSLTAHLLKCAGFKAQAVGNIGLPLCAIESSCEDDIWIIEASSYNLETIESRSFDLGVVLNITPNHLDRYGHMDEYVAAKACIQKGLNPKAPLWLDASSMQLYPHHWKWPELAIWTDFPDSHLFDNLFLNKGIATNRKNSYKSELSHDTANIKIALAICDWLGVCPGVAVGGLASYKKLPHRLESIIGEGGINFINDSKSTSVASTLHALQSIEQPIVLIAGGVHKGASYKPWCDALSRKGVIAILIGQSKLQIEQDLADSCPTTLCSSLFEAVANAFEKAKQNNAVVLFSPGCASYDMFKNFEERGERFKECIQELKARGAQ